VKHVIKVIRIPVLTAPAEPNVMIMEIVIQPNVMTIPTKRALLLVIPLIAHVAVLPGQMVLVLNLLPTVLLIVMTMVIALWVTVVIPPALAINQIILVQQLFLARALVLGTIQMYL